jgi:CCR4-NOT transcription complex subunit 7/8
MITSGLCLNENVKWITFNGAVDFAYLLKSLLGTDLPNEENAFFNQMDLFFGSYFDIKEMKRDIDFLVGGLSKVSKELGIERIGTTHQAGSDSLVTSGVFFKLLYSMGRLWDQLGISNPEKHYLRAVYGLGHSHNEDRYLDEYKSIVLESSNGTGKLLNLTKGNNHGAI